MSPVRLTLVAAVLAYDLARDMVDRLSSPPPLRSRYVRSETKDEKDMITGSAGIVKGCREGVVWQMVVRQGLSARSGDDSCGLLLVGLRDFSTRMQEDATRRVSKCTTNENSLVRNVQCMEDEKADYLRGS